MSVTRRDFLGSTAKLLLLTPAAAAFLDEAKGDPAQMPEHYRKADHWWAMMIDVEKCIGCGNCVRACSEENGVPERFYRTWVERYVVPEWPSDRPEVDSPDGGMNGFPAKNTPANAKSFFVPKMCNHCADSPCTQVCPVGATFVSPDGVVLVDSKYCAITALRKVSQLRAVKLARRIRACWAT